MAVMVNGARIEWSGYEFGVEVDGDTVFYPNYDLAVKTLRLMKRDGRKPKLRMREAYRTAWHDAHDPDGDDAPDD